MDGLTPEQTCYLNIGYILRNFERNNKDSFWRMFKMPGANMINILASSYVSLVQLKEICELGELKKSAPEVYNGYDAWERKIFPSADEYNINKIIKALHALRYLKEN